MNPESINHHCAALYVVEFHVFTMATGPDLVVADSVPQPLRGKVKTPWLLCATPNCYRCGMAPATPTHGMEQKHGVVEKHVEGWCRGASSVSVARMWCSRYTVAAWRHQVVTVAVHSRAHTPQTNDHATPGICVQALKKQDRQSLGEVGLVVLNT